MELKHTVNVHTVHLVNHYSCRVLIRIRTDSTVLSEACRKFESMTVVKSMLYSKKKSICVVIYLSVANIMRKKCRLLKKCKFTCFYFIRFHTKICKPKCFVRKLLSEVKTSSLKQNHCHAINCQAFCKQIAML